MAENDSDLPDPNLPPKDDAPKGEDASGQVPPSDDAAPKDSSPKTPDSPPPTPPPKAPPPPAPEGPDVFRGFLGSGGLLGDGDPSGDDATPVGDRKRKKRRSEMGFFEHLEELRMTILKSVFASAIGMGIISIYFVKLFKFLQYPLDIAMGTPDASKDLLISPLDPMGTVMMVISVSIYGGVILALPLIVYFAIQFVAPGLTLKEKGMLRPGMLAAFALFFGGAEVCFLYLLPAGLKFNVTLNDWLGIRTQWGFQYYYSLVVWATLATGLVFEFPLILVILQVLGIVESKTLRSGWRFAVIIIAVVGGLIAPSPDVLSMLMMMVPMLILYFGSIMVGAALRRRRVAAQAKQAAKDAG